MSRAAERLGIGHREGSGAQRRTPEPAYLAVGEVVGAHGLHGELKVLVLTDEPERFRALDRVFLGPDGEEPKPWPLLGYRLHKGRALLRIEGCDDRTMAESLRGHLVQVPMAEAIPLAEGEYFEHQILDLEVWTVSGQRLGTVTEILHTGANDVYVVQDPDAEQPEILIPALEDVVLSVELEAGRLLVELPAGLI